MTKKQKVLKQMREHRRALKRIREGRQWQVQMESVVRHSYWPGAETAREAVAETETRLKKFSAEQRVGMGAVTWRETKVVNVKRGLGYE